MTPPRLTPSSVPSVGASDPFRNHRERFRLWEPVPPNTPLSDLFTTSLLVVAVNPPSGQLIRCSPALEHGSAKLVHANVARPNAVRMLELDDDFPIGQQARELLAGRAAHVLAIPHISWKRLGEGMLWRTPATMLVALMVGLAVLVLSPGLSATTALAVAAAAGFLTRLMLRRRVPTTIAPVDGLPHDIADVFRFAVDRTQHLEADTSAFPSALY